MNFKRLRKSILSAILMVLAQPVLAGSADFVFTIDTRFSAGAANFTIPIYGSGFNYDVDCDDDGLFEATSQTTAYTCDYVTSGGGSKTIRIRDNVGGNGFPRIRANEFGEAVEFLNLNNWGDSVWDSMEEAFKDATNMKVSATDWPDLSRVFSTSQMFLLASEADPDTTNWDTSNVTDMSSMFSFARLANPNTSAWDTSNVTNMSNMFRAADSANPDTSSWNTANVTNMRHMFSMALFGGIANPDTSGWDTSNVTNMSWMFQANVMANPDTSGWNTANVTNMSLMFAGALSANPDVRNWDISAVTDMTSMFSGVTLPTNNYDTLLVIFNAQTVQQGIEFDGGNSTYCAVSAHNGLANTNGWSITDAGVDPQCGTGFVFTVDTQLAGGSSSFTVPTFGTGYSYDVDCDFDGAFEAFSQTGSYVCDYSAATGPGEYTIRIEDAVGDGSGFPRVRFYEFGQALAITELNNWGTGLWDNMENAFASAQNMVVTASDVPDLTQVTSTQRMFRTATLVDPDTSLWNTANVTDMSFMFVGAESANPDTSNWDTSNVTKMNQMFLYADVANPDTSNWNTSQVTNMSNMFQFALVANPDTSGWDTSNVTSMFLMFSNAGGANPDTSNWNTSQVTNMSNMFQDAVSANPDTSVWDTSNVTSMRAMFNSAELANPDTSDWITDAVTDMSYMFGSAVAADPDTSGWNTAAVTDMSFMFSGAESANPDTSGWDITAVTNMQGMFRGVTLPTASYEAMLAGFSTQAVQMSVEFDGGNSMYCDTAARDILINNYDWIITDGGPLPECDVIFKNSFDVPVENFAAKVRWFEYDFEQLETVGLDGFPALIGVGFNQDNQAIIKFHIRIKGQQLQIRISDLDQEAFEPDTWIEHQWQNINSSGLTEVNW